MGSRNSNLVRLQPEAERVLEAKLNEGSLRAAMYLIDKTYDDPEPDGLTAAQLMDGILAILRLKMPAAVEILDAEFREVPRALPEPGPSLASLPDPSRSSGQP